MSDCTRVIPKTTIGIESTSPRLDQRDARHLKRAKVSDESAAATLAMMKTGEIVEMPGVVS